MSSACLFSDGPPKTGFILLQEELDYSKATYGPVDLRTYQSQVMLADIWQKQGKAVRACLAQCRWPSPTADAGIV